MLVATGLASAAVERRKAGAPLPTSPASGGGERDKGTPPHPMVRSLVDGAYRRSASLLVRRQRFAGMNNNSGAKRVAQSQIAVVIARSSCDEAI